MANQKQWYSEIKQQVLNQTQAQETDIKGRYNFRGLTLDYSSLTHIGLNQTKDYKSHAYISISIHVSRDVANLRVLLRGQKAPFTFETENYGTINPDYLPEHVEQVSTYITNALNGAVDNYYNSHP